jgi:hypothetical protein
MPDTWDENEVKAAGQELTRLATRLIKAEESVKALESKLSDAERLIRALDRGTGSGSGANGGSRINAYLAGRRSMVWELRESGGMPRGMSGVEVMYLLPDEFVLFYEDLYCRALGVGMGSPAGAASRRDGGVEKAKGTTGTVLGSESRAQAQGGGKRYRDSPMVVKNEKMLAVKGYVDQGLMDLVHGVERMLAERKVVKPRDINGPKNKIGMKLGTGKVRDNAARSGTVESGTVGAVIGNSDTENGGESAIYRCTGDNCKRFLKGEWKFCPSCGAKSNKTLGL